MLLINFCSDSAGVPLWTHLDLHQEVPQVLLEGGDVLVQAEQTRYKHLHLGAGDNTV